ncbi:MAG: nitroreductase family protein [Spirochaetales bacterium]|nr:nitroreductase family protein [Spirochaetales bacterium]
MDYFKLIEETRSIRRFKEAPISRETLEKLVDCARLSPSGANGQPLKFGLYNSPDECSRIFPVIKWAGALPDWDGPEEGQRPSAYIVIALDKEISKAPGIDHGIAAQSMMLGARALGLGCCMIGAYDKGALLENITLPENLSPLLLLALGEPGEEIGIEDMKEGDSTTYFRDEQDNHHVPKRTVKELIWK